jgi:hypothetical protein
MTLTLIYDTTRGVFERTISSSSAYQAEDIDDDKVVVNDDDHDIPDNYTEYNFNPDTKEFEKPSVEDLRKEKIDEIKSRAEEILNNTDWYIVRRSETGKEVPSHIIQHRQDVRQAVEECESDIHSLDTLDEIRDYEYTLPQP